MEELFNDGIEIKQETLTVNDVHLTYFCAPRDSGQIERFLPRVVWNGVRPMIDFIETLKDSQRLQKSTLHPILLGKLSTLSRNCCIDVLELGAGVGIPSLYIAASVLFGTLTVTDVDDESLALIRRNFSVNNLLHPSVKIEKMDWQVPGTPSSYDLVIGSDLIYAAESLTHLIKAVSVCLRTTGVCVLTNFYTRLARNIDELTRLCAANRLNVVIEPAGSDVKRIFLFNE